MGFWTNSEVDARVKMCRVEDGWQIKN